MKTKKSVGVKLVYALLTLILLVAVVLGAVYISVNWDRLSASAPALITGLFGSKNDDTNDKFDYESYSDNVFAGLNDGLLVASGVDTEYFGKDGALIAKYSRNSSNPVISSGKKNSAVWSIGGSEINLIDLKGTSTNVKTEGGLISASVNDSGWMAYISGEQGYKGSVTVCDGKGNSVYKVYIGSGYPIDADISPSCSSLSVLSLTDKGSRLSVYSLDSEKEKYSWVNASEVFFDVKYLSENRICLVSDSSIGYFNGICEQVGSFLFTGEYLKDYTLDGGYAALVLGKYKTGNQGRLVTLDSSGNQTASLDINRGKVKIYADANGKYLSAIYSDSAVIYTNALIETGTVENTAGIKAAIARSDGTAIIISGSGAAVFQK